MTGALLPRPQDASPVPEGLSAGLFRGGASPEETPRVFPLDVRETLPFSLAACATSGACANVVGQHRRDVPLGPAGAVERLEVDVTWSAQSVATARLSLSLLACEDAALCAPATLGTATGPSPLRLDVPGRALPPASLLVLRVTPEDRVPGAPAAYASPTQQPFHVGGAITYHSGRD